MGDDLDIKTILVIVGAFGLGYWLVSLLMPRKKKPRTEATAGGFHETEEERARRARQRADEMAEEFRRRAGTSSGAQPESPSATVVKDERYYGNVLGLSGNVTLEDIRRRYRELVTQYHPDKVHTLGPKIREAAEAEMREINEALEFFEKKYG